MMRPRVLILAGGFGTRLAKVVNDVPKPMAPIAGRPFLEFQIEYLRNQGFRRFTLLTGHLAQVIRSHFGDGSRFGVKIDYSHEEAPLGTGGATRQAILNTQEDSFLVVNGDSFFATDITRFVRLSRGRMAMALKYSRDLSRYGAVTIDNNSYVTRFAEKSVDLTEGYLNAGIYFLRRQDLELFPEGKSSLEKDVFEKISDRRILQAFPCGGKFIDIGTPESFEDAQTFLPRWLNETFYPALFLDRDGILIRHKPYLHRVKDVEFVPEIVDVIKKAKSMGHWIVAVTNQAGVGRGLFSEQDCGQVNDFIDRYLRDQGASIDSWQVCFDHPEASLAHYKKASLRRKPGPGMLLEACERLPIDLSSSLMIGDNPTDQIDLPDLQTILWKQDFEINQIQNLTRVVHSAQELRERALHSLSKITN